MIGLRMLGDPDLRTRYSSVVSQIKGMLLVAPCDFAVHAEMPTFRQIIDLRGWEVQIGRLLGLVEAKSVKATVDSYHTSQRATSEWADRTKEMLTDPIMRKATQAVLRQAVPWRERERRPDWPAIQRMVSDYANISVPTLIVWGAWDETLPVSMGHKLKDEIPGARLRKIEQCGHSLPSECPVECAQIIGAFVNEVLGRTMTMKKDS
jgi:pimeloyl-ACP methyl ester carboxylesterase